MGLVFEEMTNLQVLYTSDPPVFSNLKPFVRRRNCITNEVYQTIRWNIKQNFIINGTETSLQIYILITI
jgi:hypothetical protein